MPYNHRGNPIADNYRSRPSIKMDRGTPPPQGGLGNALADGIKSMTYASTDPTHFEDDSDGLISSDHIVRALGFELERRGAKRL
jgi:hypothetical protein